jgi:uncharacterized membrane protein (Fun14 family)
VTLVTCSKYLNHIGNVVKVMNIENLGTIGTSVVSGSVVGILIGYAVKKVLRIGIIILGGFLGGVTCLQYQGILSINWDQVEGRERVEGISYVAQL